ncbi:hypothetical protein D3C72_2221170 [compost metagenome]
MSNLMTLGVEQFRPQRLHHSGSAVVSGTSTKANNDMFYPRIQSMTNELARAPGGGFERIT